MDIQLLSVLSNLGMSQNTSQSQNNNSNGFDLALTSLLNAISRVNSENNNGHICSGKNTKPQLNINIENLEINGELKSLDTLNSSQNQNRVENISTSNNIKLTDKNSTIEIEKAIEESSRKYGVDPDLVRAVIKVESNFKPDVVSRSGAKGLMQLMPENCEYYGVNNPFDIKENIDGGVRHLKDYIYKYDGDIQMGLMAYNGGPTRMANRGVESIDDIYKMPKETQNYVPKVMKYYNEYKSDII